MKLRYRPLALIFIVLGLGGPLLATAQGGPPAYERAAVDAVLRMLDSDDEAALVTFVDEAMVPAPARDRSTLLERLRTIRDEVRGLRDDLAVEAEPDGVRLILASDDAKKHIRIVVGPPGITDLFLVAAPEASADVLELTRDNLAETFDRLEADGIAGVVFVKLGGDVVLERGFGRANETLGTQNTLDTVFGTGSRPIDYTVAAIQLLDQQGALDLDDPITVFYDDVPADKQSMTVRHLLTGQSGLPDFFDTDADWDPDLAWIDREAAERRMLAAELHFEPGTGRQHSHAAFGLLAAIVERVSGQTYYGFIREHFLDPAGMTRTGEYGETRGLALSDFAVGGGPEEVGLPNIPPNWGPTSWLVKGSGGMYSTLGDLQRFYAYIRSGAVLDDEHSRPFRGSSVQLDGSMRGFELFSISDPSGDEVYLFVNRHEGMGSLRPLFRGLERLATQ